MRVLVTGAAGYIGSVLCDRLLRVGYTVTGIDNRFCTRTPTLSHVMSHPRFKFRYMDVMDFSSVNTFRGFQHNQIKGLLEEHDIIIPLAALVGMPICDKRPALAMGVNQKSIEQMMKLVREDQIIIYPNTNSGYGATDGQSICTELTPINPISTYGVTKCIAEKAVLTHTNTIVFRLATVFGPSPRMRLDLLVNDWAFQAYFFKYLEIYEPHFNRNYVHVDDVADAMVFACANWRRMRGQVYNLGCDKANMSKLQLAELIAKHVKCDVSVVEGKNDPDKRNYIVSSEKLKTAGFVADRGLDVGIPQLMQLFESYPQDHESLYKIRLTSRNDNL